MADDWGTSFKVNTGLVNFNVTEISSAITGEVLRVVFHDWGGEGDWICIDPSDGPDEPGDGPTVEPREGILRRSTVGGSSN